jgi:hypothetical protein
VPAVRLFTVDASSLAAGFADDVATGSPIAFAGLSLNIISSSRSVNPRFFISAAKAPTPAAPAYSFGCWFFVQNSERKQCSSAGSSSFCCIPVQHDAAGELAKPKNINALRVAAFRCDCLARILSPTHLQPACSSWRERRPHHANACGREKSSDDLIFGRAHDQMHGHAERIFHVTAGTLDVVGPQFTGEERRGSSCLRKIGFNDRTALTTAERQTRPSRKRRPQPDRIASLSP